MARIVRLVTRAQSTFAYIDDLGRVWETPFFTYEQASDFHHLDPNPLYLLPDSDVFFMEDSLDVPPGYRVFVHRRGQSASVLVWGPFGLLPSCYPSLSLGTSVARVDFDHHGAGLPRPVIKLEAIAGP